MKFGNILDLDWMNVSEFDWGGKNQLMSIPVFTSNFFFGGISSFGNRFQSAGINTQLDTK